MEATDFRGKGMANNGKEKMSFLRQMILINDPLKIMLFLIQGTLYPGEESQKILVRRDNQQNLP